MGTVESIIREKSKELDDSLVQREAAHKQRRSEIRDEIYAEFDKTYHSLEFARIHLNSFIDENHQVSEDNIKIYEENKIAYTKMVNDYKSKDVSSDITRAVAGDETLKHIDAEIKQIEINQ